MARGAALAVTASLAAALAACGGSTGADATTSGPTTAPAVTATAPATTAARGAARATAGWPTYNRAGTRAGTAGTGPALGGARRLWSTAVQGTVYAQPLVVGTAVVVASEADVVTALDAASGRALWTRRLGTPVSGSSLPCGNIDPSGVTGTPVADPSRRTLYVVAFLRGPRHELFALDLRTGAVRWRRPIDAPGADPAVHQQRAALALSRGRVYIAYGGLFGDCGNYRGRVVSVPASGPGGALRQYVVPTPRLAGIWAPGGPAVDAGGNLYVATGNGASVTAFDYGNAVVRLSPALRAGDFFAPLNTPALSSTDTDLGSTGPVLLGAGRAFVIGKDGVGYLLNARRLGGIGHPLGSARICSYGAFGATAYRAGTLYVPCTSGLTAVTVRGTAMRIRWRTGAADHSAILAGPGLWALGGSDLLQLDPGSGGVRFRAAVGGSTRFSAPAAAGGRVFVAAGGRVLAFR